MVTQSANKKDIYRSNTMEESSVPSEALIQLISPDGYYTYLGIPKPSPGDIQAAAESVSSSFAPKNEQTRSIGSVIDEDLVKKNYRKLSLKHHPDKRGGDAETFRVLNRAQKVLMNPKLRQQYDILGLDLDDDEDENNNNLHSRGDDNGDKDSDETTAQGIVHEIASMVMASIMHLGVRTVMMCLVSVVVVRYRITIIPAFLFLAYVCYQLFASTQLPDNHPNRISMYSLASPLMIGIGLLCMHWGRAAVVTDDGFKSWQWTWLFWVGETVVIAVFAWNSISASLPGNATVYGIIGVVSAIAAFCFRGRLWNYVVLIVFEAVLILLVVTAFPIMEMLLEAILNEKLRKVGDKVRAHQKQLETFYANKELRREQKT